ncbi:uncharacterized protein LOC132748376 [Ruditapes philippinarum]|uniref:uncharacterized protein LOC132748376 n=1 Tax=Ruditapes philippinarum TaxID=129788 RepID=UPI00295B245D|nr:uncharacterized protein LOC132748376 [Ruditapes philippinarum]
MAPTWMAHLVLIFQAITVLILMNHAESQDCTFPKYIKGNYFSMENGESVSTIIDDKKWGDLECKEKFDHPKPVPGTEGANHTFLVRSINNNCLYCIDVLWRTQNVLQFRKGDCLKDSGSFLTSSIHVNTSCEGVTNELPSVDSTITMFKRTDTVNINCISTFEGVFQFTYEVNYGGGGICDNPDSQIQACQDPGSSYIDNQVFRMRYSRCRDVSTSQNKMIRYQCFGTWFVMRGKYPNEIGYTYAVIADTVENDQREKFKCLMTNKNQKEAFNKVRWVMSRFADCRKLNSIYDGPVRLVLTRIPPATTYLTPQCSLPRNLTGTWLTQGVQYQSNIKVNDTHIYFFTPKNEFEYQETYYSCQQSQGTRHLMTKVVVGKCEVDFTCFDIVARHHSIVKFRVGKPYQYKQTSSTTNEEVDDPKRKLREIFREACSWTAFTFNRDEYEWNYETMIQNPPSPVACPIAGRYTFSQTVRSPLEKFQTRIRGVTDKPRVQVACRNWVTEFKSCSNTMTRIEVDAEYCESVDYRGRPIGEYDEPDNTLTCVGFWMEDMKSYLVTWDEEDAISAFRCWVYERKSWTGVYMSRAQNARCPREQSAKSAMIPGTGLALDLTESERLFDDCPQRFDPGANPYSKPITLWVLNKAGIQLPTLSVLIVAMATAIYSKWIHS